MSLRFAILGLLTFEPMTGYTLKTRYFDKSIAHFWPADQAQIYRTLQMAEADGDVTSKVLDGDARPGRRLYALTDQGRESLVAWLAQEQPLTVQRDAFLVQLYFGRLLSRDQILQVLHARRDAHARQRDYFDRLEIPQGSSPEMSRQVRFGALTLDFARRQQAMMVDWLDASIKTVKGWGADT